MNYVATSPNAILRLHASDMTLNVDRDAEFLVMHNAKSRIAGNFQLNLDPMLTPHPKLNSVILVLCKALRHVVTSAAES